LSDSFWRKFPKNTEPVAKPNIDVVKLKQVANTVGVSDKSRLDR